MHDPSNGTEIVSSEATGLWETSTSPISLCGRDRNRCDGSGDDDVAGIAGAGEEDRPKAFWWGGVIVLPSVERRTGLDCP